MESDHGVHIDLYNLEDVKFEGSKYVLTSPRSLEACSQLDVKPIELLYKPLSEFQEELLPQDVPLRRIYALYDESEQIRQKKLKLCREGMDRTSQERKYLSTILSEGDATKTTWKRAIAISPTKAAGYKRNTEEKKSQRLASKESVKLHRELLSKNEKNSLQQRPTLEARPQSVDRRKTQRCISSVTKGSHVIFRSGSVPNMSVILPARDEKILNLMKRRKKEEKKRLELSGDAHLLWDTEKKREDALKIIAENKRRRLLAEENRIRNRKMEVERQRDIQAEEEERERRKLVLQDSQLNSEIALMNQLQMKELQLFDKTRKETVKKVIQENYLKSKELEDEGMQRLLLSKQLTYIHSASERKGIKLHQESLKKFLDNKQERQQFEQRKDTLKSQEKQNEAIVRSSMETRLGQAETNLSHLLGQRDVQLEEHRREEQTKLQRARSAHKKMEAGMEAWRHGLLQHKKMLEVHASEVVNKSIELKSCQVRKDRINRKMEHKKNISKIHKDVEKWRHDLERSLLVRDRKVEDLLEEKERSVTQTRAMAQLSQMLRDDVKEKYESDTFDKKVVEAELYASINNCYRSSSPSVKNRSSIKLF